MYKPNGGGGRHGGRGASHGPPGEDRARPPGRRRPPPESTGAEADEFRRLHEAGEQVLLRLAGGETLEGTIEEHDRETIELALTAGGRAMIRKRDVRLVEFCSEEDASID